MSAGTPPQRPAPWAHPAPADLRPDWITPRLTIRAYTPADAPALFAAVNSCRDSLVPWLPWAAYGHKTLDDTVKIIDDFTRAWAEPFAPENSAIGGYVVGLFDQASGAMLGGAGFNRIDAATHNAETGYWLVAEARGHGLASEACTAMLDWGFTPRAEGGFEFRRIHLFASSANHRSCAVPRRLGLHQHMDSTADRWLDGLGYTGTSGWEVLGSEWRSRPRRTDYRATTG